MALKGLPSIILQIYNTLNYIEIPILKKEEAYKAKSNYLKNGGSYLYFYVIMIITIIIVINVYYIFNIWYYIYSKIKSNSKPKIKSQNKKGVELMDLSKEAREARNKYMREWRRKNKDKVKKYQKDYWERQASNKGDKEVNKVINK